MTDESERALTLVQGGLLRAVEAEARRRERIRMADLLHGHLIRLEQQPGGSDGRTAQGRRRIAVEDVLGWLPLPDYSDGGPWTEHVGSVTSECDGIDVALNLDDDGDGDPDPWPYRLKVYDGAEDQVAYAYLSDADVQELIDLLGFAGRRWAEHLRSRRPVDNPPAAPVGD